MRCAAHDVRRAHQHAEPGLLGGPARPLRVVGNSATRMPCATASSTCATVASSWLASTMPRSRQALAMRRGWARSSAPIAPCAARNRRETPLRHLQLAHVVHRVGLDAGELALARRMVHQRGEPHPLVIVEMLETPRSSRRADTSQRRWMKWSARSRSARTLSSMRVGELAHVVALKVGLLVHADAQRVEDGGDAGGRRSGRHAPARRRSGSSAPRARRIVAFEMVGVELDQSRNE